MTVALAGDTHVEDELRPLLDQDPATALASLRPYLGDADLTIVNLETALTTRGSPEDKEYTFRAPPAVLTMLAEAGVDVVSMANNHGVDYGEVGLADTLAAVADAPLAVVGIGADDTQAFAPHVTTVRGTRIAVLAASAVDDPTARNFRAGPGRAGIAVAVDPDRLVTAVRQARQVADVVIVYLHWGTELVGCPTDDQRALAETLAEAGADVIAGTHAHVQLGAGRLPGHEAFVAYGLGNFVWYSQRNEQTTATGVLTLTLDGRTVVGAHWAPARIGDDGLPRFATGKEAETMRLTWESLRKCANLGDVREPPVQAREAIS